jgi:hypothetical protein
MYRICKRLRGRAERTGALAEGNPIEKSSLAMTLRPHVVKKAPVAEHMIAKNAQPEGNHAEGVLGHHRTDG